MIAVDWPWHDLSVELQTALFTGVFLLPALIALQFMLLPPPKRQWVFGPSLLYGFYIILLGLAMLVGEDVPGLRRGLDLAAYLALLLGLGRSLFALVFYGVLRWLHQHVPRIFLDVIQSIIYLLALVLMLVAAGVEPLSLLTGSAVLSVVLGLSLKDTLGNLFAGIAIQAQQPFEIGDWIAFDQVPSHIGRVVEINWRAIKVITLDDVEVIVPNGTLGVGLIVNYTKPKVYSRRSVFIHAPYNVPPKLVQGLILEAIADSFGVLREPPPSVVTNLFDERGVQYWVRFFTDQFDKRDGVDGSVRDCAWYALNRAGIAIPGVQQSVALRTPPAEPPPDDRTTARETALRQAVLFGELSSEDLHRLALISQTRLYAPHEAIVRQGEPGEEMFVVVRGSVTISVHPPDATRTPVTRLGPGDFFGEMSLVSGAVRTATVQANDECELIAIGAATFRQLLESSPELAERVRSVVAHRQANLDDHIETVSRGAGDDERKHFLLRFLAQLLPPRN